MADSSSTSDLTRWSGDQPPPHHSEAALEPGRVFGAYRLLNLLGRGAFGVVWEAEHEATGRRLALKVFTARASSPDALARFHREGRLAASINDPHCVFVFGAEEIDGHPTVSMELMAGGTLQEEIEQLGRIQPRRAVDQILDVIDGLEAARAAGILHRDVKPSNCFIDAAGTVKVGDFGISKTLEPDAPLTQSGGFLGTPVYASPEQVRGRDVDFRSDIYSLGATLYALLTGTPPFTGGGSGEVLARVLSEEPIDINAAGAAVPTALVRVVRRMMAKDRTKRYQDYASLRTALLPFSTRGVRTASLASRFGAYVTDLLILWIPNALMLRTVGFDALVRSVGWPVRAMFVLPSVLYFGVSEWYWGRSLGKYLFRLRVTTEQGLPPSLVQTLGRILILSSAAAIPAWLMQTLGVGLSPFWSSISTVLARLPLVTMRRRNGFAGVHELLTHTRVMAVPTHESTAVPSRVEGGSPYDGPLIGSYRPRRLVWSTGDEALIIAVDEVLQRPVWIHTFTAIARGRNIARLAEERPHRLHWLAGSRDGQLGWDAYEAPSGTGLSTWLGQQEQPSWRELQPVLMAVTDELTHLEGEAETQTPLSVEHIWVDRYGKVTLLDFPAALCPPELLFEAPSDFLFHLAVFVLEGRLVPAAQLGSDPPSLPMPDHAQAVMQSVAARAPLPGLCAQLHAFAAAPTFVTRARRMGPLLAACVVPVCLAVFPLLGVVMGRVMLSGSAIEKLIDSSGELRLLQADQIRGVAVSPDLIAAHERIVAATYAQLKETPMMARMSPSALQDYERALSHYPAVSQAELDAAEHLVGSVTPARSKVSSEKMAFDVFTLYLRASAIIAAAAVVLTWLFRAPLFLLSGITVQTRSGSRASRARHLLRGVVEWSPFLIFLPTPFESSGSLILYPWWLMDLDWPLPLGVLALPWLLGLAGIVVALAKPSRGIPDLIAGTYLVPR